MTTFELATIDDPWTLARWAVSAPAGLRLGIRHRVAVAEVLGPPDDVNDLRAWIAAPVLEPTPPLIDLAVGIIATTVPALDAPAFLRFATAGSTSAAAAHAKVTYLLVANRCVAAGLRCGWLEGPGLAVDPARVDASIVRAAVCVLAAGLRALDDPHVAESFLDYCAIRANPKEEAS